MRAHPFCKLYFTKLTKFAFFLITIMFISQKCIIFASNFKNGYKISKKNSYKQIKILKNYEKSNFSKLRQSNRRISVR